MSSSGASNISTKRSRLVLSLQNECLKCVPKHTATRGYKLEPGNCYRYSLSLINTGHQHRLSKLISALSIMNVYLQQPMPLFASDSLVRIESSSSSSNITSFATITSTHF